MLRQLVSVTLVISFIALGISGIFMIILNSFAFQLQMHPVHKVFGLIMVIAGCLHVYLNLALINNYLRNKRTLVLGGAMSCLLILLFIVGVNKPLDQTSIEKVELLMSQMEANQ